MTGPWRAKVAAVVVLFFLGTFAGQIQHLLDNVRGKVERGAKITDQIRATVTTIENLDVSALQAQIAELQSKLAAGTATPAQISQLQALVGRLRGVPGPSGNPGPPGPQGASGPPGAPVAVPATTTTTTTAGAVTTSTTRPATTTTSTTRGPGSTTTTTTRCAVGVGQLLRIGCG